MAVDTGRPKLFSQRVSSENGFALPFTIFLITIITIMLAAAFTRATADNTVASNSATEVSALAVAQSGLQAFIGESLLTRPAPTDSFRYNVTGGYAWVYPELAYQPADTAFGFTYIVRSVGHVIYPTLGPDPQATRTIAQFARWSTPQLPAVATLVAVNGIYHVPNPDHDALTLNGIDDPTCTDPIPATMGYRGPDFGGTSDPGNFHSLPDAPDPPHGRIVGGLPADVADEMGIDWSAIVYDDVVTPDLPVPVSDNSYLTYVIAGNYTLTGITGTGLLIVTGDLELAGTFTWRGVVLVGGELIVTPNPSTAMSYFYGMIVTGLNDLIGPLPAANQIVASDLNYAFQYSSCSIEESMKRFVGFHTIAKTWVDNWATY